MASRRRSQRPMLSSTGRSLPARLLAFIAARCAAPTASVLMSAITPLLVQPRSARSLPAQPLPEPVTMAQAVGAAVTAMAMVPLSTQVEPSVMGGMGGYGFGTGAYGCYPTFDYSTGWNEYCPGTGFAFWTGNRPAQ